MEKSVKEIEKIAESPENSRIRAEIWGDFVGWDNRRRGENGFLVSQLNRYQSRRVLDVALGDGVDTIYLLQQGFDVSCNEIDDAFRKKAIENAKNQGCDISPTALDWRDLTAEYGKESVDAIICMGNSLTCLFDRENQLEVLRQFRTILKPGGALLIDERNYQRILDNRAAALSGELHSTGEYLYTGTKKVQTRFVRVTDDEVIVEYVHNEKALKAYYRIYPFKRGELLRLLQDAGFPQIQQFSDYQPGNNPDADFYQYVCVK